MKKLILGLFVGVQIFGLLSCSSYSKPDVSASDNYTNFERFKDSVIENKNSELQRENFSFVYGRFSNYYLEKLDDGSNIQMGPIKIGVTKITDSYLSVKEIYRNRLFDDRDIPSEYKSNNNIKVIYIRSMTISDIELENMFMVFYNDILVSVMFDESYAIKKAIKLKYNINISDDRSYDGNEKILIIESYYYKGRLFGPKWYGEKYIDSRADVYGKNVIVLSNKKLLNKIIKMEQSAIESIYKQRELEEKNRLKSSGF